MPDSLRHSLSWSRSSRVSLDDRERDVIEIQVLAPENSVRIGLGNESPARVVEIDAVLGGVALSDPLPQGVHVVGSQPLWAYALRQTPARVVDVLVEAVVSGRAVVIECKAARHPRRRSD